MEQETITQALDRVTAAVGAIKSSEELEAYIKSLPFSLQSNGKLIGLFNKRRTYLLQLEKY